MADGDITEEEAKAIAADLERSYGGTKVIRLEGSPKVVIVKTTDEVARKLRNAERNPLVHGRRLATILTSGAIGNLKRRVKEEEGQWPSS